MKYINTKKYTDPNNIYNIAYRLLRMYGKLSVNADWHYTRNIWHKTWKYVDRIKDET